ncbi:MAG: 2-hydroxy-3-oxopropionate reductase [Dehalococcoidia bacterium]|nr:2-hydroxy-3-oxopropionate reductase [Dehalococcoidia bacterium]
MKETVGFIGLGLMGKPMSLNLLRAGYPLVAHSRSPGPVAEVVKEGAERAATPRELASHADVVITMLPDTPDVETVLMAENGVFAGMRPGCLVIDMSTISPVAARRLAAEAEARGAQMLDAPVSGGDVGAINATLSIMVGGPEEAFQRALPLFLTLGKNIVHVGGAGAGQICKACNQIVAAMTLQAVSEALVLARKAGVDPAKVRQALLGGFAASRVLEVHGQRMLDREFRPGFRSRLHAKDLNIALATGREYNAPLPGTAQALELYKSLLASGHGDDDNSALVLVLERLAGMPESTGQG